MNERQALAEPAIDPESNRRQVGAMLRSRYGIDSEFVRVATLAKVLGIAAPTIYSQIRSGAFFLPHRRLNSMPAVKFDDLVDWHISNRGADGPTQKELAVDARFKAAPRSPAAKASYDDLVKEARLKMAAGGKSRMRP